MVSLALCCVGVFFTFWGWESVHFCAQESILFDLTQPGGEPFIGCHSHSSIEWNLMCFPSVFSGSGVKFPHAQVEILYLLPQCGMCKFFPVAFVVQEGLLFSPRCEPCC